MSELYKNAPLKEAVFEIRFPAELSIECRKDEFREKIRDKFPMLFVPQITDSTPYALKSYAFKTNDQIRTIGFTINTLSFHLKKYEGFAKFENECLEYMSLFCKLFGISKLNRTGLRYVNHIPVLREEGIIPIERYIKLDYLLPESIPSKFELFHTILVVKKGDGKVRILTQCQELKDVQKTEIILLDFDYYLENTNLKAGDLKKYLESSHYYTKEIFEDLLSEEYKKIVKGEK